MNYLMVGTVFKNESWGMKEWIEHHRNHGVDHIVMVDDGSTDDYKDIILPYINDGYVTLYHNDVTDRYSGRQIDINNKYFMSYLEHTKWFATLDMDEYLYNPRGNNLKDTLRLYESYGCVEVNWAFFTSSGYIIQPESIVDYFIKRVEYGATVYARAPGDINPQHIGSSGPKTIINTDFPVYSIGIHNAASGGKTINVSHIHHQTSLIINHYQLQSREYWENVKMNRGDVNHWFKGSARDFEVFDAFDAIGNIEDTTLKNINKRFNNAN